MLAVLLGCQTKVVKASVAGINLQDGWIYDAFV